VSPRALAREILRERRFHKAPLPQPLRKPLHSLGHALAPIGRALKSAFDSVARHLPGGHWVLWILLAAAAVAITLAFSRSAIARRRRRSGGAGGADPDDQAGPSRRELEREAERAEQAGRFDAAVRLRFGAGLLALAQRGVIEERASLRTGEVAATLRSHGFDAIAHVFDEVVYGGRPAQADDARAAREGWRDVLREARA
jgi:hypothetical protein